MLFNSPLYGVFLLVTYVIFWVIPADPAALAAGKSATPADIARVRHFLHLDQPIWRQYLRFVWLLIGHGSLHWAELYVASGAAALFVATEPVWVAVLSALTERDARLSPAAMSLLCGGAQLIAAAALSGSLRFFDVARVTAASAAGLAYLVVLGSVTFAGYVWLLTRCSPVLIATHTYTNPLIAVLLGAAIAGERLTPRMAVAGAAILLAIALVRRATPSTYLDHDETIARDPDPLRDRSTRAVHAAARDGRSA